MATLSILREDLIEEILVRVPSPNLKRLRSVCKQWNDLYNDRRFTKKHLLKSKQQFLMMKLSEDKINPFNLDLHGIHPTLNSSGILSFHDNLQVINIFHCHGLLLCITRDFRVFIWNPFLEQVKLIEARDKYMICDCYGIGYDKKREIHKILKFPAYYNFSNRSNEIRILDLNTADSWKILENVDFPDCSVEACGVSVKGNGYWKAKKIGMKKKSESYIILSFDFTKERFRSLCSLPPLFAKSVGLSSVRDEKLAVLIRKDSKSYEIWMSSCCEIDDDERVLCWSKVFNVDFNGGLFCFVTSFLVDEEKRLVVCSIKDQYESCGTVYVGRDGFESVEVDKCGKESWMYQPFLLSFAPSLVQVV